MILINYASAPIRKQRLNPTRKARKDASRNKFVEKGEVQDKVESLEEVDSNENRSRARLGFVKPIRN